MSHAIVPYSQRLDELEARVRAESDLQPRLGMVLGSGLGGLADEIADAVAIPFEELPGWPAPSVPGRQLVDSLALNADNGGLRAGEEARGQDADGQDADVEKVNAAHARVAGSSVHTAATASRRSAAVKGLTSQLSAAARLARNASALRSSSRMTGSSPAPLE